MITLDAAKEQFDELVFGGTVCPCCDRFAKVYRRKLNAGMARSMISMYRLRRGGWIHLPTEMSARSREEGKLAWWGLAEEQDTKRDDGGRAGYWRLTRLGINFVLKRAQVPSHILLYDNRLIGHDGHEITIEDALGAHFNYQELMRA